MKRRREDDDDDATAQKEARTEALFPFEALLPEMRGEVRGHMNPTGRHLLRLTSRTMLDDDKPIPPIPTHLVALAEWKKGRKRAVCTALAAMNLNMWDGAFDRDCFMGPPDLDFLCEWHGADGHRITVEFFRVHFHEPKHFIISVCRERIPERRPSRGDRMEYETLRTVGATPERINALYQWIMSPRAREDIPTCLLTQ